MRRLEIVFGRAAETLCEVEEQRNVEELLGFVTFGVAIKRGHSHHSAKSVKPILEIFQTCL